MLIRLDLASPITIRTATESDLPAILAIYNDAGLTRIANYDYEPRSPKTQRR